MTLNRIQSETHAIQEKFKNLFYANVVERPVKLVCLHVFRSSRSLTLGRNGLSKKNPSTVSSKTY